MNCQKFKSLSSSGPKRTFFGAFASGEADRETYKGASILAEVSSTDFDWISTRLGPEDVVARLHHPTPDGYVDTLVIQADIFHLLAVSSTWETGPSAEIVREIDAMVREHGFDTVILRRCVKTS